MAESLHGAGLVNFDVGSRDADHAFAASQQCINHSGVGLSAAYEQENLRVRKSCCLAYQGLGRFGMAVAAVAARPLVIALQQVLENLRQTAVVVVAFERNHLILNLFGKYTL